VPLLLPSLPSLAGYKSGIGGQGVEQTGPPVSVVAPVISGNAWTGQTLSCNGGSWSGAPPLVLTYQWENAGSAIGGATTSTYVLQASDEGDAITCDVTCTNGDGDDTVTSNTVTPTAEPATAPVNTVAPVITGTAQVGETLSCSDGTWTGNPTPTLTKQWYESGSADTNLFFPVGEGSFFFEIAGETGDTLDLDAGLEDQYVFCVVTGTNTEAAVSAASSDTGPVIAAEGGGDFLYYPTTTDFPSSSTYPVTAP